MTARLMIHVQVADGRAAGGGLVATIWPMAGGDPRRERVVLGGLTPVEVEEGPYLIEVVLPSGERIRTGVEAKGDVHVSLTGKPSPHEWLAQHAMLVPRRRLEMPLGPADPRARPIPRLYVRDDWPKEWCGNGLPRLVDVHEPLEVHTEEEVRATQHDRLLYLFEVGGGHGGYGYPARVGTAVVQIGDRTLVLPVALGWHTFGAPARMRIVVNAEARTVSTSVDDPYFGPVMNYLALGRKEDAATSLGSVPVNMLFDKLENPFAAAAGAYVLVDDLEIGTTPSPSWRQWITNLANWFPALADGAVLEGRALQRTGEEDAALGRFLEAFDRGMPLFAEGVRLLLEGLLSYQSEPGDRVDRATRSVRRWASWLDPREPFTTLDLPLPVASHAAGSEPQVMSA